MNWQWTSYTLLLATAAAISFFSAAVLWAKFRHKPAARMGTMLIFGIGWWMLGIVLEVSSATLAGKIFWDKMQFLAIVSTPPGWVTYTLRYVGRIQKLTLRRALLLWFIPTLTLILVFTNELHGLIWSSYELIAVDGIAVKTTTYGPAFWLFMVHANLSVLTGLVILVRALAASARLYRWQVTGLMITVIVPWMVNAAAIFFDWRPIMGLDLTPVALVVMTFFASWMVYRLQVRDIGPAARHLLIDQMGDALLVLDGDQGIIDLNPVMVDLLQRPKSQLIGRPITRFWSDWPSQLIDANQAVGLLTEWTLGETESRTFDMRMSPLFNGRNQLVSRIIVLRDIGERKQMEEHLKASLREKSVLLKEIHHRVKNNLQIISSLLNLQAAQAGEPAVLQALQEGQGRVRSMALIHEILYRSDDLAHIDFGAYICELTTQLCQAYNVHTGQVTIDMQMDKVFLTMETAVPCGLILNELVSNALKHAFVDGRSGQIAIRLQAENNHRYDLVISDNGIGFPPHLDYRQTTTLGLQLVHTLIDQLEGHLAVTNQQGTSFTITFENRTPKETS